MQLVEKDIITIGIFTIIVTIMIVIVIINRKHLHPQSFIQFGCKSVVFNEDVPFLGCNTRVSEGTVMGMPRHLRGNEATFILVYISNARTKRTSVRPCPLQASS